jgi:hypothetical protein
MELKEKKAVAAKIVSIPSPLKTIIDVLPHGIHKNVEKNTVYAVFKIIVGFVSKTPATDTYVSKAQWEAFAHDVDGLHWTWSFNNKQLMIKGAPTPSPNDIKFCYEKGADEKETWSLHLGKDRKGISEVFAQTAFEKGKKFILPKPISSAKRERELDQMGSLPNDVFAQDDAYKMIKMDYTDILEAATAYTKDLLEKENKIYSDPNTLNLKTIYSSVLEEPYMAQYEYGLVREFRIDIREFFKAGDDDFSYAINMGYPLKSMDDTLDADFRMIKKGNKFYNGLNELFISSKHFTSADGKVRTTYDFSDPYKNHLNKSKDETHPDGIYVIVDWKDGDVHVDPFNKPYLKGFNVVVKHPRKGNFNSLSQHIKKYKGTSIEVESSGVMIGNCTLDAQNKVYTNNVLFAWRGDNLIVNRDSDEKPSGDNVPEKSENFYENEFVRKKLIDSYLLLKDGSQEQLWLKPGDEKNWEFNFYLRTVSPLEGYMKTNEELSKEEIEWDCILTLENISDKAESILKKPIVLDTNFYDRIITKAPLIAGPENYKNAGSIYVDQEQHMVLSKGEFYERRYIYPPSIKFEDFKYFGWLTPEKIEGGEKAIDAETYAFRCMDLEDRAAARFIALAKQPENISYLPDERVPNLIFFPSDLYTINRLSVKEAQKPFEYDLSYPYFDKTRSKEFNMSRKNLTDPVDINLESSVLYPKVADGIYNFRIYSTGKKPLTGLDKIKSFNYTDMRISVVNEPNPPLYNGTEKTVENLISVARNEVANNTSWYFKFNIGLDQDTWKSLKMVEKTEMLRLMNMKNDTDTAVTNLKLRYEQSHGITFDLLDNEFPYEIFLDWDDTDLSNNPLSPIIYPASLSLKVLVTDKLRDNEHSDVFFSLPISDEYMLKAVFEKGKKTKLLLNGDPIFTSQSFNTETEIVIEFVERDAGKPVYLFQIRCGTEKKLLGTVINPTISVNDIAIDESLLQFLNLGSCMLNLTRSADYVIIGKEKDSYYKKKRIRLFASSIFQAYYPKSKSEWEMGKAGTLFKDIELPNNLLPEKCELDTDIYVMQKTVAGTAKVTEITKDNLIMITLPEDFMKEGPNNLGLIISEVIKSGGSYAEKTDDMLTSEMGEDVTKLTENGTKSTNLLSILNFDALNQPKPLDKYYNENSVKYYQLNGKVYKVLECKPHYNALSRNWQVMLSFDPVRFGKMESIFVKFTSFKIAPGQKLETDGSSYLEAYVDKTRTCFSDLSKPVHLPIYTRKSFTFENKKVGARFGIEIKNTNISDHKNKVFFVMIFRNETLSVDDNGQLNIGNFDLLDASGKVIDTGNKLHFTGDQVIISPSEGQGSVVVLEFEKHKNFKESSLSPETSFVSFNPLFDTYKKSDVDQKPNARGLRLINVIEYK